MNTNESEVIEPAARRRRVPGGLSLAAALAAAGLLLSGCTVGPNYKAPETRVYDEWGELIPATGAATGPATRPSARPPVLQWWRTFDDPQLDALVDRAVKSNLDLRLAQARVREARAVRDVTDADLFPNLDARGEYTHSRSPADAFGPGVPSSEQNFFQAGFDARWEIDVFGGVRRSVEAADADIAAAVEDRRDVLVSLLAEVARNYVDLRGFQRQITIARENLATQQQTLDLTVDRQRGGLASDLDVARARAQVATTGSQIPALEAQARQSVHRLGVLVGQHPMALSAELTPVKPIPQPPPDVPVGVPSELLRRRPDVRRAERQLAAATARIGAATADLFPRFSLTGSLGLQNPRLNNLFDYSSRFWSVGPSVSWPVFDAGRIRANIRIENAREEQAVATYERAVLTALQEVEDALVNYVKEEARRRALVDAAEANRKAVDLANQLWVAGRTDFLSVLQAQRDLFVTQDALVQSDRTVSTNLVTLYKVLGGGWEIEADVAAGTPTQDDATPTQQ